MNRHECVGTVRSAGRGILTRATLAAAMIAVAGSTAMAQRGQGDDRNRGPGGPGGGAPAMQARPQAPAPAMRAAPQASPMVRFAPAPIMRSGPPARVMQSAPQV